MAEADSLWKLQASRFRAEEIAEAQAAVQGAEAALHVIEQQIAELKIASPVPGHVEAVELQPGDLIAANAPALSIVSENSLWVRAYVPANRTTIKTGQEVTVQVDSFPRETFCGRVIFIARRAEFTPSNVQTIEERAKQVYRVKIEMLEGHDRLRAGMPADVRLDDLKNP